MRSMVPVFWGISGWKSAIRMGRLRVDQVELFLARPNDTTPNVGSRAELDPTHVLRGRMQGRLKAA